MYESIFVYDSKKEKIIKCLVIFLASAIGIASCVFFGVYAYKHRVIERKQYFCIAVIDDKKYEASYATTYYNVSTKTVRTIYHPAEYYIYYTVKFEDRTYGGNKEEVKETYYKGHQAGEEVNAVFEKQWRADGSETYDIWLVK